MMRQTIIRNLTNEILKALKDTEAEHDPRFKMWIRRVDGVNRRFGDTHAFKGEFMGEGIIELILKPSIFVVKTINHSSKSPVPHYSVFIMDKNGQLVHTEIHTSSNDTANWALPIRDAVAKLLWSIETAEQPLPRPLSPAPGLSSQG